MIITIGFSKPKKFKAAAKLIMAWQRAPYSHVYLRVYNTFAEREMVYQASRGDVHCLTLANFLKENEIVAEFEYEVAREKAKDVVRYCVDNLQRDYGYAGLLLIMIKRLIPALRGDGKRTYHCSEFAARVFPEISAGMDPDFIEPIDLYRLLEKDPQVRRVK